MIHVIATVELAAGTCDKCPAEFIPDGRAEAGCVEYGATVDAETTIPTQFKGGADRVVVIEKWETAALLAHGVAPDMQAYRAKVKDDLRAIELLALPAGLKPGLAR